jgi:hypothetical protein
MTKRTLVVEVSLATQNGGRSLERIVSKGRDHPCSSHHCDWIKVKCHAWRKANKDRHELFKNRP